MADDKENPAPDPWANFDAGDAGSGDESFSFDAVEQPLAEGPDALDGFSFSLDDAADGASAAEPEIPPEPAVPVEPAPPAIEAEGGDELAASWLGSPEPLAAPDVAASAAAGDDDFASFVTGGSEPTEDASGVDVSIVGGSSTIEIGTGQSGIVSGSDIVPDDEPALEQPVDFDFAAVANEPPAESFDFGEAEPVETAELSDEPAADEGFDSALAGGAAAGAAAVVAAPKKSSRPALKSRPAKQGGVGQMIGVVLGGLMALPITYAILVWGFGKDPFKFTKSVPPEFAFLLPAKFQPGTRPGGMGGMPKIDRAPSLDQVAQADTDQSSEPPMEADAEPLPEEPNPVERFDSPIVEETEPDLGDLAVTPEPTPEPAAPPPLDLSGVEAAIDAAMDDIDTVSVIEVTDPTRKKVLTGWYKKLAKIGEELAQLETVAADTGRPLAEPPGKVAELYERIAASDSLVDDIKRLCRDWVSYRKRPADGVMLVAILEDVRKVGPYWCSTVSLEQADGTMKPVSVISRMEPKAAAGDRAIVAGVVFDDDVVWASDLRPLAASDTGSLF